MHNDFGVVEFLVESYDSTILEAYKDDRKKEARAKFIKHMEKEDPELAKKYKKNPEAIDGNKKLGDKFEDWCLAHKTLASFLFGSQYVQMLVIANKK